MSEGVLLSRAQAQNSPYARGSAVEMASGLPAIVNKNGVALPPSVSYLQAQAQAERHKLLNDAWKHYTGDIHGPLRAEAGQPDLNVHSNRASTIVDTGVDFLYGATVRLEVTLNDKVQPKAQAALDACWGNDDRRMTLLSKLAQNGGIFGHVFAKIIPPSDALPHGRIVPLDPSQVTVVTDPMDCDAVMCYIVEWNTTEYAGNTAYTTGRKQVIMRIDPDDPDGGEYNNDEYSSDPDATWQISNWLRGPNNTWYELGEPETWPHSWAPIVDWQNLPLANMHWGQSDIPRNIQQLNNVLDLTLSNINAIAKHHSFPWLYASGVGLGASLEIGPGKLTQLQAPEGKISAVEAHGDVPGLLSYADDVRSDMDEQSRVPAIATGRFKDLPRATSGIALQMLYGPLIAKNTHKRRLYGAGHEELSLRMLALLGFGDGTGNDGWCIKTVWQNPLPNDDQATAMMLTAATQAQMSQHFICKLLDVDYDEEQEYKKQEAQDALTAFAHGQGMPPAATPAMPGAPAPQQPGQPPAPEPSGNNGQMPPTNHPAAVAQRAAVKAVSKLAKAGAK